MTKFIILALLVTVASCNSSDKKKSIKFIPSVVVDNSTAQDDTELEPETVSPSEVEVIAPPIPNGYICSLTIKKNNRYSPSSLIFIQSNMDTDALQQKFYTLSANKKEANLGLSFEGRTIQTVNYGKQSIERPVEAYNEEIKFDFSTVNVIEHFYISFNINDGVTFIKAYITPEDVSKTRSPFEVYIENCKSQFVEIN